MKIGREGVGLGLPYQEVHQRFLATYDQWGLVVSAAIACGSQHPTTIKYLHEYWRLHRLYELADAPYGTTWPEPRS